MTPEPIRPPQHRTPRRGTALVLVGVVTVAILFMVHADGGGEPGPAWAIRASLDGDDIGRTLGGKWAPDRPPVQLESVAVFARAFVPVPDDRFASAWRDPATGATVFQVTLVYDDESDAIALESGSASALLRQHFGLGDEPMTLEGVDLARRHAGPTGFEAISIRIGRGVTFIGGAGLDVGAGVQGGLPELEWTHQGVPSPRLAALSDVAAARLREVLESAAATATAASESATTRVIGGSTEATEGP